MPFPIIWNRQFKFWMQTFEKQLTTSRNFNHFGPVFVSAKKYPSFSDATSTVSFFCSRRPQKLGDRSCSALNNPTEEWESCSEWIVWPEFSHGCGKFGSWFQNLPVSWLQLSFQLSKLNVLDVAVNSIYDCIDDHLIQSNNISGKKRS